MKLLSSVANSVLNFGHLMGLGSAAAATTEPDELAQREGESDDDYSKRTKSKKDDPEDQDRSNGDSATETPAADTAVEVTDTEASTSAAVVTDDSEMFGDTPAAAARSRERERCAAIFASPHAAKNVAMAATLAFSTKMSRSEAIAVMENLPAAPVASNPSRAARNPNLSTTGSLEVNPQVAVDSSWDVAMKSLPNHQSRK